jgi:aryl-alcohol dehydrogenase-like predicted oxidoreductase
VTTNDEDLRPLGKTGARVLAVSLGGEGILRTSGRGREAVPMILEALRLGVRYCDTAPAYDQSQDYYGAAFREAGPAARAGVFLASKVHLRGRDEALRLLDDSLRRLGTDHLDLWQLHDLRDRHDLDAIFAPRSGALAAALQARAEGRVRFLGITGHQDPGILLEAMGRHPFDSVLCPVNPADPRRLPFVTTVVAEARRQGMAVVGMKVLSAGRLPGREATAPELIRYAASQTDTVVIGCSSAEEVRANLAVAGGFLPMPPGERHALEQRIAPRASRYDAYKG